MKKKRRRRDPLDLLDWSPAPIRCHSDDPDTSFEAAAKAERTAGGHKERIIRCLQDYGAGLISEEIAIKTGLRTLQVVRRISTLFEEGLTYQTELRRENADGNSCVVWWLTEDGLTFDPSHFLKDAEP
jgi:hypothetical protein